MPWSEPGKHSLLAVAEEQIAHPSELVRNHPSRWHSAQPGNEVLMVTSGQFASQLSPLVRLRQSQGKSVAVVRIDDLYDEFNFGERSPDVIRDLLKSATEKWQRRPKYVLLVGDASVDPRNYLGFGSLDFVPTKIIVTSELKTASDDWFSDFKNTGFGQIPTGRLPVRTVEEAKSVVAKILAYERGDDRRDNNDGDWINQALLVADRNDTVDFYARYQVCRSLAPQRDEGYNRLSQRSRCRYSPTRDHGWYQQWEAAGELSRSRIGGNMVGRRPVGQHCGLHFVQRYTASRVPHHGLPQRLLPRCIHRESGGIAPVSEERRGGRGLGFFGIDRTEPQAAMDQNLVRLLFRDPSLTLGDAIMKAKTKISDPDTRRIYILFGDPLLRIRRPAGPRR